MFTSTASPTTPLDLVLHIGSGKTGTSSIQQFMAKNRERLAEHGVLYPRTAGATRHVRLGHYIRSDADLEKQVSWRKQKYASATVFRQDFERGLSEEIVDARLPRVLLSDEALYGSPHDALRRLRTFLGHIATGLQVIVYLRRQDDHLCSRYQQVVKTGEVRRFADRTEQMDLSATYDYLARLRTWQRLVEPRTFVVRAFERESFVDGSLLQDFLQAAGIEARACDWEQVGSRNESLDAESTEFLRILNVYLVEQEGMKPGLIDHRKLVYRLADISTGPTLTLPDAVLDTFMAQWEESNRGVAREFKGDPTGQLFHAPRKRRNTTTEQHLDPERLDHFLEVAELPARMHDPLRRLAEREATSP